MHFLVEDKDSNDCATQWSLIDKQTGYFTASKKQFMMNFRVENLDELLKTLTAEVVSVLGESKNYDYGKFGWILDAEGNKIELWESI